MELDIKNWSSLAEEDRQVILIKLAYDFNLGFKLSYNMPSGHETDNGYYLKDENILYFNYMLMKDDNTLTPLFNLLVEIRKVMQILNIDSTPLIQRARNYDISFYGTVTKIDSGSLEEVTLEGERKYLKQIYICAPNVYDANKFAYDHLYKYVKDDSSALEDLNNIYEYWKPTFDYFDEKEMDSIYKEIFDEADEKLG